MEQEKSKKWLIGVLIVIIVLLLCVIGYLLFGKELLNGKTNDNSTTTTTTSTTTTTIKQSKDENEAVIKNGECINLLGTDRTTKNITFLTDLGVDIKHVVESPSWGDLYIGNKMVASDLALTRACVYNKYIVLGLGEGSSESFKVFSAQGEDILGKYLPDYEINNNIITSYEMDYNNKNMSKLTIDLSGATPKITSGSKEKYTCSNDCSNSGSTLKEKIIWNVCCSL